MAASVKENKTSFPNFVSNIKQIKLTTILPEIIRETMVNIDVKTLLHPLQPDVSYFYPLKILENLFLDFQMFSGGIDKQHRAVMGYY